MERFNLKKLNQIEAKFQNGVLEKDGEDKLDGPCKL
jgi:hypothetical protein